MGPGDVLDIEEVSSLLSLPVERDRAGGEGRIDEISDGLGLVVLLAGTVGVEVAKEDDIEAVGSVVRMQQRLEGELAGAVGIDRPLRVVFFDRYFRGNAVDGRGRGVNDSLDLSLTHGLEEIPATSEIGLEGALGVTDRFRDDNLGREVKYPVVAGQGAIDLGSIPEIAYNQLGPGRHLLPVAGRKVIEDGNLVTLP